MQQSRFDSNDPVSNSELYQIIMQKELSIEKPLLHSIEYAFNESDTTKDAYTKEGHLKRGLENFSISDFTHSTRFASDWENYIKRGV